MAFFNKKTDVMDIELTPYGRYLLSIGRLKPAFTSLLMMIYCMMHLPVVLLRPKKRPMIELQKYSKAQNVISKDRC